MVFNGNTSNFTVNLQRPIEGCDKLELLQATIPNTIYNITSINQNFTFNDGTATRTATVAVGQYSSSQLLTALGAAITATSTALTFTLTLNVNTLLLTISATGSFSLLFVTATNQMYDILGFQNINYAPGTTITAPNVLNVSYPTHILITISEAGNTMNSSNTLNRATFIIPIDRNSTDLIYWNENEKFKQWANINGRCIEQLNISLSDRNNQPLSVNGAQWQMLLRAC